VALQVGSTPFRECGSAYTSEPCLDAQVQEPVVLTRLAIVVLLIVPF